MRTKNNKTYLTWMEFEAKYNKGRIKTDYLKDMYIDEREATVWYNSAGCKLAV